MILGLAHGQYGPGDHARVGRGGDDQVVGINQGGVPAGRQLPRLQHGRQTGRISGESQQRGIAIVRHRHQHIEDPLIGRATKE